MSRSSTSQNTGAILIKTDHKKKRLLTDLARQLGANVVTINDEQYEDFTLGLMMDTFKTGQSVAPGSVLKKLRQK
jgi:hypothetical protein